MKPIIVINLKTYQQGKKVIELVKKIEKVSKKTGRKIIIGVQLTDIKNISEKTKLEIYSQHVDYFEKGRNTGFVLPESVKTQGAVGTFLNHSEHPINFEILKKTIKRCKKIKLKTAVFTDNLNSAKKIQKLKPDFLIYEPSELVGGNISVSTAKPESIKKISREIKIPFLVGAGIKTKEDIKKSLDFGAKGVAFSSVITLSKNPEKSLMKMISD